jgi:hypothetical protein
MVLSRFPLAIAGTGDLQYPCWELHAVGFLAQKIHHGDTEFTEVARNLTRGWTLFKILGWKSDYAWGNDNGLLPVVPEVHGFWGVAMGLIGHPANAISEAVIGAAIEVHRQLGPGLLESSCEFFRPA